ncbi:MAG: asparagine synthase (glutamine-hydrolyzing) [Nitrospiraceae bacterium]
MCGIAAICDLTGIRYPALDRHLHVMNALQRHRGPDGEGLWCHPRGHAGFGHRRLSIIDLEAGQQPMSDGGGNWVTYNGESYNYRELRVELGQERFKTNSDTEVILHAYRRWGVDCVDHFRGMFSFALWDEEHQQLFCARDRFGIKPFYYTVVDHVLYLASEMKALLPFVADVRTNLEAFKEYLTFQFCLAGKTLIEDIHELVPGHVLIVRNGFVETRRYWEVYYDLDWDHTEKYFEDRIRTLLEDSVALHLRSDVPVGAYVSGGLDSSIVASMAGSHQLVGFLGFTGKFSLGPAYDESRYARELAQWRKFELLETDIGAEDFVRHIQQIIYHLDQPVAGPGSFPQYMVSQLASRHRKVVLGGQGGDEIFGGYARYLIAYFEQCIKAAIDGTTQSGNFIVTYESIIPNLSSLREYKPLLQEFWRKGLFEDLDRRYFRLINRARDLDSEINWPMIDRFSPFDEFNRIFRGTNVRKESYFDCMTHFDFKTLLPALLHVEDRMSMAHGLESRVPFLDHPLVEFVATIPSNVKFMNGRMKHSLKNAMRPALPPSILNRTDKMGFPVPLQEWLSHSDVVQEFVCDIFSSQKALTRDLIDNRKVVESLHKEARYGRKIWGLLSLELWQQAFHDRIGSFKQLINVEVTR